MDTEAKTSAKGFNYAAKIGALIAMAEDERLPQETRDAYRAKAEELMKAYRISEEQTIAGDAFAIVPVRREVVLMENRAYGHDLLNDYRALWREVAEHAGVRFALEYRWVDRPNAARPEDCSLVAVVYGYDMDIRLAEFYWTAARLVFMTRIDVRVNPDMTDQVNCYFLRNSGLPRNEVAQALWGSDFKDGAAHGKVQKLYLAECVVRGEEPRVAGRGIQVGLYRTAYANAFVSEFGWRLRDARMSADTGGGLELPGRAERVNEAFYTAYPDRRPMTDEEYLDLKAKRVAEEAAAGPCKACEVTKSKTGMCRRHRPSGPPTQADYRRWAREGGPEAQAGRANGTAAAKAVNVSRTAGQRTQKADPAPVRHEIG